MSQYKHVPQNIQKFVERYFQWQHLPLKLQVNSSPFGIMAADTLLRADLAVDDGEPVDWAEVMVGLRNLLQAKDCVVRAFLP